MPMRQGMKHPEIIDSGKNNKTLRFYEAQASFLPSPYELAKT